MPVLVVDDGSSDGTGREAEAAEQGHEPAGRTVPFDDGEGREPDDEQRQRACEIDAEAAVVHAPACRAGGAGMNLGE